jgi:CO dehydrogenase/acetyl-CoA synthase beta subunit
VPEEEEEEEEEEGEEEEEEEEEKTKAHICGRCMPAHSLLGRTERPTLRLFLL